MLAILKVCVIVICVLTVWAQENAAEITPETIPAV